MINFRYHVVSLTAVFLALAIGLVVGTAALNGPAAEALENQVNGLRKANTQLRSQVNDLNDQANRKDQFVTEAAPIMLSGKLTGRKIVVISVSAGREYVEGVSQMLTTAGAKITGVVSIQDKFFRPDKGPELLDLVDKTPNSVPSGLVPTNVDGVESASALLAAVLLNRTPAVVPDDIRTVLAALTKNSYISVAAPITTTADAAVFVAGTPFTDSLANSENTNVLTSVVEFDRLGVMVVGGVAGDGTPVTEVREDVSIAKTISTVDGVSTLQGQVATALALAEQLGTGKAGHYGVGSGATSLLPHETK